MKKLLKKILGLFGLGKDDLPKSVVLYVTPPHKLSQVSRCLGIAEKQLGIKLKPCRVYVKYIKGSKTVSGAWGRPKGDRDIVGATAEKKGSSFNVTLYTDPRGNETDLELTHELRHCIYWTHGIPGPEHHNEDRKRGLK